MRISMKKGLAAMAAVASIAAVAPFVGIGVAAAATDNGTATLIPTSGNETTPYSLQLPAPGKCAGDNLAGYNVQSFMVPNSVDLNTLTFNAGGPVAVAGQFRAPLFSSGNPYVDQAPSIGTAVVSLPGFDFSVFPPATVPNGQYKIGIACTLGGARTLDAFWSKTIDVTNTASGFNWAEFVPPLTAPTGVSVAPANQSLVVSFTAVAGATSYTVTATPPSGPAVVQTGAGSPITVAGLTNGTVYAVTVTASTATQTSPPSTPVNGTPSVTFPAVNPFTATPAVGGFSLNWGAPAGDTGRTGYNLVITPTSPAGPALPTVNLGAAALTYTATGLGTGTYSCTLTATYGAGVSGTPRTVSCSSTASQVIIQDITVTRPVGALVLTQVCGAYGALAAETAQLGFPAGLPAATALNSSTVAAPTAGGTAPTTGAASGGPADPVRSQYPYPTNPDGTANPTYPTHCGISLGNAQFVRSGAGAGQFFAADGRLNQVTIVDTRDADTGWNAVGQVSNFTSGPSASFSGSQLGWVPVKTEDTSAFTDSLGNTYDQVTTAGGPIAPNTLVASGLSSNRTLLQAAGLAGTGLNHTGGLGTAIADARLKLLIPITAQAGTYTATMTISSL